METMSLAIYPFVIYILDKAVEPLLQNTTLSWDISSVSSDMHGKRLECQVINHPYGDVETEETFNVIRKYLNFVFLVACSSWEW